MKVTHSIPPEWRAAVEADPQDSTWKGALADWFDEWGDSASAECLRWVVGKGVGPVGSQTKGFYWVTLVIGKAIPGSLSVKIGRVEGYRNSWAEAFDRLLTAWHHSTEKEREEYWQWKPLSEV